MAIYQTEAAAIFGNGLVTTDGVVVQTGGSDSPTAKLGVTSAVFGQIWTYEGVVGRGRFECNDYDKCHYQVITADHVAIQ